MTSLYMSNQLTLDSVIFIIEQYNDKIDGGAGVWVGRGGWIRCSFNVELDALNPEQVGEIICVSLEVPLWEKEEEEHNPGEVWNLLAMGVTTLGDRIKEM